jgi:hypothetical protein
MVVPQSPQQRLFGGYTAPHFGQRFVTGAPQSAQNFLLAGLSLSQLEQHISSPVDCDDIYPQHEQILLTSTDTSIGAAEHAR